MRVPKPHRVTDKALLKALRLGHCELCGKADDIGVHHIITRNAGGLDARCNCLSLCIGCHNAAHAGNIDKVTLWAIVARREGVTPDEAEAEARELTRRAHCGEVG